MMAASTLSSWVPGADPGEFPLACLPYGTGARAGEPPRVLAAIGDYALDIAACAEDGLLGPDLSGGGMWRSDSLNRFIEAGPEIHTRVRSRLQDLLAQGSAERSAVEPHLLARDGLVLGRPVMPPDFVDFYASYHHAVRSMAAIRPDLRAEVEPNWRAMPVGYHARTGSIVGPDVEIRRPNGQYQGPAGIVVGPSQAMDFELEIGIVLARGSANGERVPTEAFGRHAFGITLLNDWSARDLQRLESRPLGPFTAKSFATQIGPWIVPMAALSAAAGRNETQATAAAYLRHDGDWTFDVVLEARLQSAEMRRRGLPPVRITQTNLRHMHWDPAQLLAHLTVNGAGTRAGDLLGTGTASGPEAESAACLLELTSAGKPVIELPDGSRRGWLQDGDEVILAGTVHDDDGAVIASLGELRGRVGPASVFS